MLFGEISEYRDNILTHVTNNDLLRTISLATSDQVLCSEITAIVNK